MYMRSLHASALTGPAFPLFLDSGEQASCFTKRRRVSMSSHTSDSRKRAAHSSPQGSVARCRGGASGASGGSVEGHLLPTVGDDVPLPLTNLNFQHYVSSFLSALGSVIAGSVTAAEKQSRDYDTESVLSTFEDPIDELVKRFLPKAQPMVGLADHSFVEMQLICIKDSDLDPGPENFDSENLRLPPQQSYCDDGLGSYANRLETVAD
jgi:hypothetical protein